MGEISIHEENKVARAVINSFNNSASQSELSWTSMQNDLVLPIDALKLFDNILRAIWRVIIYNDDFEVQLAKLIKTALKYFSFSTCMINQIMIGRFSLSL